MKISILSMFPEVFDGFCKNPIVARAINSEAVSLDFVDIKEHTNGCYRKLDDSPYGGGKGMILRVDALCNALNTVLSSQSHVVLLSPKGSTFNQQKAKELTSYSDLVFVCGHYEGYDARIESYVDECISIGDFILSGGEQAAAVICDSVIRLLPGVLKDGVTSEESFEMGLLEHNQYTHPVEFEGKTVPSVLLNGNQAEINKYKKISSIIETVKYRPDLLEKCCDRDYIGKSTASVLFFGDFVLKVENSNFENSDREYKALKWLCGKVEVPEVYEFYKDKKSYLLMDKIKGRMLCDEYYCKNPTLAIKLAANALKELWSVDISSCTLDASADAKLKIAKYNIEHGLADFEQAEGFDSRESLYNWLVENKPEMDPVFSHGDFCLPNILISKKGKFNFIDLGLAGVGDRYCDIALCLRSLKYNLSLYNPDYKFDEALFFEMVGITPDYDKIRWYTLLDEEF